LFFTGTNNACPMVNPINLDETWAALSSQELEKRKARLVSPIAADVKAKTEQLIQAWDPKRGNFLAAFTDAGHGSQVFAREQDALNAVNAGLFYIEKEVKDIKLGRPLGISPDCQQNCSGLVETPHARIDKAFIQANLEGFRLLFQGCGEGHAGLGFDDWLRKVGMGQIADDMLSALDKAEQAAKFDGRLEDALVNEPQKVVALYDAIKALTDLLKGQFVTVLDLEVPMGLEGDND
jgi:hypothetical protein